jgi:hypothetical protein
MYFVHYSAGIPLCRDPLVFRSLCGFVRAKHSASFLFRSKILEFVWKKTREVRSSRTNSRRLVPELPAISGVRGFGDTVRSAGCRLEELLEELVESSKRLRMAQDEKRGTGVPSQGRSSIPAAKSCSVNKTGAGVAAGSREKNCPLRRRTEGCFFALCGYSFPNRARSMRSSFFPPIREL